MSKPENNKNEKNEEKYLNKKLKVEIGTLALAVISFLFSVIVSFTAKNAVQDIKVEFENTISNIQEQYQSLENQINTVQEQYLELENIINQQQTVDVIQARDNDVLIKTPDDKWLVIPMIEKEDISFANEIIEKQYNSGDIDLERVDMFNYNNEDWSNRDGFTYTLPFVSFNQNKMVSLYQFITKIE